jgi:hypothetical protein
VDAVRRRQLREQVSEHLLYSLLTLA